MKPHVLGIAGWKNSGKTTLVERLVREMTARSYSVSTLKHAHHSFDLDQPGKDSHRHRSAGAMEVAIVSANRWAIIHELRGQDEPSLAETITRLSPCDLVIVEGWKWESHPKIEVRRRDAAGIEPLDGDGTVIAIAADFPVETALPLFDLDAAAAIADFVEERFGLRRG
jgi:molybdopterin-guanine dinucleotide biosynthesis protein B